MSSSPTLILPDDPAALFSPLRQIWLARAPTPTASGLAYKLGWLAEEFHGDGVQVGELSNAASTQSSASSAELTALFREGGNVPALAARAQGVASKLIGLTWIDEWQVILVRPDSAIHSPADLAGKRLALPAFAATRGASVARAMSLHGFKGTLAIAGLALTDARFVEVPASGSNHLWAGLDHLARGEVDAVYVKGASAVEAAQRIGAKVGIDLDRFPDARTRINNGTPRPITVHQDLLENHFDTVVRFLAQSLRAADWATNNRQSVLSILQDETRSGAHEVATAYRDDVHLSLHPSLDAQRIEWLRIQKDFLWLHGFLEHDVDLDAWIDPRPLQAALDRYTRS